MSAKGYNSLHIAVKSGDLDTVIARLTVQDVSLLINAADRNGHTPLHYAASKCMPEITRILLENGADRKIADTARMTPLHYSAIAGDTETAKALLAKGARVNAQNAVDDTPLHIAAEEGRAGIGELLLRYSADIFSTGCFEQTLLHRAALGGNTEVVKLLLDKCRWLNAVDYWDRSLVSDVINYVTLKVSDLDMSNSVTGYVNRRDIKKNTSLYYAVSKNYPEIVKLLVDNGARIEVGSDGNSLRNAAISARSYDVIKVFLDYGVSKVDFRTECELAMFDAISIGDSELVRLISQHAIGANIKDDSRCTPLHYAALRGTSRIAEILIENGANVNAKAVFSLTPLHFAAKAGNVPVLRVLLKHNANAMARTWWSSDTPHDLAVKNGRIEAAEILRQHERLDTLLLNEKTQHEADALDVQLHNASAEEKQS